MIWICAEVGESQRSLLWVHSYFWSIDPIFINQWLFCHRCTFPFDGLWIFYKPICLQLLFVEGVAVLGCPVFGGCIACHWRGYIRLAIDSLLCPVWLLCYTVPFVLFIQILASQYPVFVSHGLNRLTILSLNSWYSFRIWTTMFVPLFISVAHRPHETILVWVSRISRLQYRPCLMNRINLVVWSSSHISVSFYPHISPLSLCL